MNGSRFLKNILSAIHPSDCFWHLPASGFRDFTTGALNAVGTIGDYWSSAPYAADGGVLYFNSGNVNPENGFMRAYAFPVRCVQHLRAVFIFPGNIRKPSAPKR